MESLIDFAAAIDWVDEVFHCNLCSNIPQRSLTIPAQHDQHIKPLSRLQGLAASHADTRYQGYIVWT